MLTPELIQRIAERTVTRGNAAEGELDGVFLGCGGCTGGTIEGIEVLEVCWGDEEDESTWGKPGETGAGASVKLGEHLARWRDEPTVNLRAVARVRGARVRLGFDAPGMDGKGERGRRGFCVYAGGLEWQSSENPEHVVRARVGAWLAILVEVGRACGAEVVKVEDPGGGESVELWREGV